MEKMGENVFFFPKFYLMYAQMMPICKICLYPINVKTAEPNGPKFFVGHPVIPGKVYGWSNFQKFAFIKIRFLVFL